MNKLIFSFLERITLVIFILAVAVSLLTVQYIQAADTDNTNLRIQINESGLAVGIVDDTYASVPAPAVSLSAHNFSFDCGTTTGTFGSATEMIYIQNPDSTDGGWSVTIAASSTDAVWESATSTSTFDFNDIDTGGCADGSDSDSVAGLLTIDPSLAGGTKLATGTCAACSTTGISLGSPGSFNGTTTESITIATATSASDDIGDWTIIDVAITQTIPPEQEAYDDYAIDLTLTII